MGNSSVWIPFSSKNFCSVWVDVSMFFFDFFYTSASVVVVKVVCVQISILISGSVWVPIVEVSAFDFLALLFLFNCFFKCFTSFFNFLQVFLKFSVFLMYEPSLVFTSTGGRRVEFSCLGVRSRMVFLITS